MPIMRESEMEQPDLDYCILCGEYTGDIYLCGMGMICTVCFAQEADIAEAEAYFSEEIAEELKRRARTSIHNIGVKNEN